ncbi:MAG: hydantoinase/oxoprolinase family protein [Rhodospirillales bacterium]|jgi:N-methylhydantoinase A|nr:hydantoinase/oxoprolinase family protein [Rhodospirillales bacterium]
MLAEGYRLAVDIGGTFTDVALLAPDGRLHTGKVLSTVDNYGHAVEDSVGHVLCSSGVAPADVTRIAHGTTVASNALFERRGASVALLTTRGFRDVLELGRFRSPRLYDLTFQKPPPLVERRLRFQVGERIAGDGRVLQPLEEGDLDRIAGRLDELSISSVAVCFLNAHVNPEHEIRAAERLSTRCPGMAITISSQLAPQIQEYERTSTTVVNAYLRPVMEAYLGDLERRLNGLGLTPSPLVMQSSGGLLPAAQTAPNPVFAIESGPAGGVVGAQRLAARLGIADLIVFDMGGTTAKATLVEKGQYAVVAGAEVCGGSVIGTRLIQGGGFPIQAPTIDIAEVGVGGGSIAWPAGSDSLRVGPESASASPGPACYGRGGTEPTVTDANLILGYLNPSALLGGALPIERDKAETALAGLGEQIGRDSVQTAYAIHRLVNADMVRALRSVSVERGTDPARFTLFSIGGNGSVHACDLAEMLRITRIVVPPAAGVFSALGLLFADPEYHLVRTFYRPFNETNPEDFNGVLATLRGEAEDLLRRQGFSDLSVRHLDAVAEMKYFGQSESLPVPLPAGRLSRADLLDVSKRFDALHQETFGYASPAEDRQFVMVKVVGRGITEGDRVPEAIRRADKSAPSPPARQTYFGPPGGWVTTPVSGRDEVGAEPVAGPWIIEEFDGTVVVAPGWTMRRDTWSNLILDRVP